MATISLPFSIRRCLNSALGEGGVVCCFLTSISPADSLSLLCEIGARGGGRGGGDRGKAFLLPAFLPEAL